MRTYDTSQGIVPYVEGRIEYVEDMIKVMKTPVTADDRLWEHNRAIAREYSAGQIFEIKDKIIEWITSSKLPENIKINSRSLIDIIIENFEKLPEAFPIEGPGPRYWNDFTKLPTDKAKREDMINKQAEKLVKAKEAFEEIKGIYENLYVLLKENP